MTERRQEILEKCRIKVAEASGSRATTYQLERGLPTLYDELIEVLRISLEDDSSQARYRLVNDTITAKASLHHARESYRLGYTVSQLVHGYGCICQGITEFAHEVGAPITSAEFSQLNLCLDTAIAQAVSEFEALSIQSAGQAETLRLGSLAHELRNYLTSAIMSHEVIKSGGVGTTGAVSSILTNAHQQMKELIDRAVAEVRLHGEPVIGRATLQILSLLSEVESSALPEANANLISLRVLADPSLYIEADRHLMASAIANLVQNAIKFTLPGNDVWIRAVSDGEDVVIEVEDRCGGLPKGSVDALFRPYVQGTPKSPGLGLGLSIARRAIELNGGELSVRDLPGTGCIFTARMPAAVPAQAVAPR